MSVKPTPLSTSIPMARSACTVVSCRKQIVKVITTNPEYSAKMISLASRRPVVFAQRRQQGARSARAMPSRTAASPIRPAQTGRRPREDRLALMTIERDRCETSHDDADDAEDQAPHGGLRQGSGAGCPFTLLPPGHCRADDREHDTDAGDHAVERVARHGVGPQQAGESGGRAEHAEDGEQQAQ